jgi:acetyl esterase/lipase
MPSLAIRIMPLALTLRGSKKQFSTAEATLARVAELRLRPRSWAPPRRLSRRVDITVRTVGGWPVYEVTPRRAPVLARALYLHGGAYVFEIAAQHWSLVADLAVSSGTRFTVPIFPLAPADTAARIVPAATDLAAARIGEVGAENTTILGDSAGGGMALAVAMRLRDERRGTPKLVLISPWLDISGSDPQLAVIAPRDPWLAVPGSRAAGRLYRGDVAVDDPMVSPINGSLAGLGPITLLSGTRDIVNADAVRLVRLAAASGHPLDYHEAPEMLHVYPLLPIPEAREARRVITRAIVKTDTAQGRDQA